jgi:hypothetical protein
MISPPITLWDSFGSPDILEYVEMKFCSPFCWSRAGPGSLEAEYKKKIQCQLDKQHMTLWWGLTGTQETGSIVDLGPSYCC